MLRADRGWNQKQLAAAARVSNLTIVRIENEGVNPHPQTLHKVANALGVRVADLYEEPAVAGKGEAVRLSARLDEIEEEMRAAGRGLEMGRLFALDNDLAVLFGRVAELDPRDRVQIRERILEMMDRAMFFAQEVQERAQDHAAQVEELRKKRGA